MVLFETVRDLRFADNIENTLSSIDNELKKANLLKERELELKDKEIKLKKDNDFSKEDYKKAFDEACARLEDMDKILYKIDQSVKPFSKERYQDIILTNIHKLKIVNFQKCWKFQKKNLISSLKHLIEIKQSIKNIVNRFNKILAAVLCFLI